MQERSCTIYKVVKRSGLWYTYLDQAQKGIDGFAETHVTGFYADGHDETRRL